MNSTALLNNILKGDKKGKKEATVMATIVERRFPTPTKPGK